MNIIYYILQTMHAFHTSSVVVWCPLVSLGVFYIAQDWQDDSDGIFPALVKHTVKWFI